MTSGSEKNYIACQASYPHSLFGRHLYDFFIVGAVSTLVSSAFLRGVGEGCALRRYARLVGAPKCTPSLRSVVGLLLALALKAPVGAPLASLHKSLTRRGHRRRSENLKG